MALIRWLQITQVIAMLKGFDSRENNVYVDLDTTIELVCPNQMNGTEITWFGPAKIAPIAKGSKVYRSNENQRLSISGNYTAGEYKLKIHGVKSSDFGKYKCSISFRGTVFQHDIHLIQKKTPSNLKITNATGGNKLHVTEGKRFNLECTVTSGTPRETLILIHHGIILKESKSGRLNYIFTPRITDNHDQYTCKAVSLALDIPIKTIITLNVEYAPRISFTKNTEKVTEGNSIEIKCYVNSNPETTHVIWGRISESRLNIVMNDSTLRINIITRGDAGTYFCKGTNRIGYEKKEIEIIVLYSPDINIVYKNYTEEFEERVLRCNPDGIPKAYVFFNWEHLSDFGDHIRYLSGTASGILHLPDQQEGDTRYQDSGYYRCTVSNGIADTKGNTNKTAEVFLSVKGKPVFVFDNTDTIYGVNQDPINVVLRIYSNPKYTHIKITSQNHASKQYKFIEEHMLIKALFHKKKIRVIGYRITLKFHRLQPEDYTVYTFTATNQFGESRYNVSLQCASPPDIPLNFTVYATEQGAMVHWTPNFNGGFSQIFMIQYKSIKSARWENVQIYDKSTNEKRSRNFNNLTKDTIYYFRMLSRNKMGDSNVTDEHVVYISDPNAKGGYNKWFYIAAIVFGLYATFICITISFKFKKRCGNTGNEQPTVNSIEVEHYEMIDENNMDNHIEDNRDPENTSPNQEDNRDPDNISISQNEQEIVSSSSSEQSWEDTEDYENNEYDVSVNVYEQISENQYDNQSFPYDKIEIYNNVSN